MEGRGARLAKIGGEGQLGGLISRHTERPSHTYLSCSISPVPLKECHEDIKPAV